MEFNYDTCVPITLFCGHSICRSCAERIHALNGAIACPMCRKIDKRRVQDMATSYAVLELVKMIAEQNARIEELSKGLNKLQLDSDD